LLKCDAKVLGEFRLRQSERVSLDANALPLDLVMQLKRNPIPYLLAIATASNIGSVATITGNPQNIIIGSLSHIPYSAFAATLAPVATIGLVITTLLIALVYRSEFFTWESLKNQRYPRITMVRCS
jgi:Na+/H+ antiporter NhaD/arsenite permease-like protein